MSVDRQTDEMHKNHANVTRRVVSRPSLRCAVHWFVTQSHQKNLRGETKEAGLSVGIN